MNLPYDELLRQLSEYYQNNPIGLSIRGDKVGIEPIFDPDTTKSGLLYIPETSKGRSTQGIVKALGPKCSEFLRIGDYVIFSGYDGDLFRTDNGLTIVMPESKIHAKFVVDKIVYFDGGEYPVSRVCNILAEQIGRQLEVSERI